MSEHKHEPDEREDLQLDAETVRDLEPKERDAEEVRGGAGTDATCISERLNCQKPN
jgi:hypothetical protein